MESSDDECEHVPDSVSDYDFLDEDDEPISFSELPVKWDEAENLDGEKQQIFLRGTTDDGLQKIYKQVIAWKFDLSHANKPNILVLSKENNWIKLLKPRKVFEDTIRTTLITVQCLHFLKGHPESSVRTLWDHLSNVFRLYEPMPSNNDLMDHTSLINEVVKRDKVLARSKVLVAFLEEKPKRRKASNEVENWEDGSDPPKTQNQDASDASKDKEIGGDESDDEEEDLFESVCAICDNGGTLLCCEGECMRSFHATEEAGSDSACVSLGLSDEQVEAIQNFYCKNCEYKQQQCFACGELGSSDTSSGAEVFRCVAGNCARFYHPHCVAKLLHGDSEAKENDLLEKIAAGDKFLCPVHRCDICKQLEQKQLEHLDPNEQKELQFAICRRCPRSYHRKCLPREIAFEDDEVELPQRAWEGLIPNRILIYCLKHEIDEELLTPLRNHIKFPGAKEKKKQKQISEPYVKKKILPKEACLGSSGNKLEGENRKPPKVGKRTSSQIEEDDSSRRGRLSVRKLSVGKKRMADNPKRILNLTSSAKREKGTSGAGKLSLGEKLYSLYAEDSEPTESVPQDASDSITLDDDAKRRIMDMVKDVSTSITLEDIVKRHKVPSKHLYSSKYDKNITLGKVEGTIQSLHHAIKKLERGGTIEDAGNVCDRGLLNQLIKWKIVDMLHWYVRECDTVVDFCCGSNDFSCLLKKKMDEMGKSCSYRNYDILQAKNDFNFQRKDWMDVSPEELPPGSQLIMGLNPPFGVNAAFANKFIDKALEFKPKLLILIVPPETERLDEKKDPYDLVWENDELLTGKAFYLPGSIDVNDKQMEDWNVITSPLYLWSRPDWTARHKAIARQHGHLHGVGENLELKENKIEAPGIAVKQRDLHVESPRQVSGKCSLDKEKVQLQEQRAIEIEMQKDAFHHDTSTDRGDESCEHGKTQPDKKTKKGEQRERKRGRQSDEKPPEKEVTGKRLPQGCSSSGMTAFRLSEGHPPKTIDVPSYLDVGIDAYQVSRGKSISGSQPLLQTGYYANQGNETVIRHTSSYSALTNRSCSPAPGPEYGFRTPDEQNMGFRRENMNDPAYRSYIGDVNDKFGRNSDTRSQVQLFGQQHIDSLSIRSSHTPGTSPVFSSSWGGPSPDSTCGRMNTSRMAMSAMQRYAPRLDELNHTRMDITGPQHTIAGRSSMYDPRGPRPRSLGFAPGPYYPFSQQNSSGWLNE